MIKHSESKKQSVARRSMLIASLLLPLSACDQASNYDQDYQKFVESVRQNKMGSAADHWIEMQNITGEWEKTGLVFGYGDDFDECKKAIAGLKSANTAREYRCIPAQP